MEQFCSEFNFILESASEKLRSISEERSSKRPRSEAWSTKEILGHLVDSSINNAGRFIDGQFKDELIFSGYDQDKWVAAQNYQTAEWSFIIDLWLLNNLQILRAVKAIPEVKLQRMYTRHNFDAIAFREIPSDKSSNLEYLIRDYLNHMKHHLNRIFEINSVETMT